MLSPSFKYPLIRKFITPDDCCKIVKKLNTKLSLHYEVLSYEIVPLPAVSGFMGQYYNLRVKVKVKHSANTHVLKFFVKAPPPAGSPQDDFNQEMGSFKKEFDTYNVLFPKIMVDLPGHKCVPDCYFAVKDKIIVMDDLKYLGFKTFNKHKTFDFEHCAVVMKTLGKFHARSIIFEDKENKSLSDEFSFCVQETLWPTDKIRSMKMFYAALKGVLSLIDLLEDLDDYEKLNFKEKFAELAKDHPKNLQPSETHRNVLCHGDLWANNLLFKYNPQGNPVICRPIDFQLTRYNPPAHDILCFLQFTTLHALRAERLSELLHVYHESLTKCLTAAELDAAAVFPWQQLADSVEDMRLSCMLHAALNVPMQLIDENAINKYFAKGSNVPDDFHEDRSSLFCEQFQQVPIYKFRIIDSLMELYQHLFGPL